jgi:Tfp pilus assembly protein PilF
LREAQVLDPLSTTNSAALALSYLFQGKDDQALLQARKTLEIAQNDAIPHALLGLTYERKHLYPEAVEELRRAVALSQRDSETLGWLGWVLAREGRREADALNIKMEFAWAALRADVRFQKLLQRSGLSIDSG